MEESPQRSGEGGWGAARAGLEVRAQGGQLGWEVQRVVGPPGLLHRLGMPAPPRRLLRWCRATGPALVLGSSQPDAHVDHSAAGRLGIAVVRRLSGGSSVVVGTGKVLWLDVVVPAGDALWDDDVGVAPLWLGRAWAAALRGLGVPSPSVHRGPMVKARWSDHVCFAGTAPGEVRVPTGKVVGISQRRSRGAALFQCGALLQWDAGEAVAVLAVDRPAVAAALAGAATGIEELVGAGVARRELEDAVASCVSDASAANAE